MVNVEALLGELNRETRQQFAKLPEATRRAIITEWVEHCRMLVAQGIGDTCTLALFAKERMEVMRVEAAEPQPESVPDAQYEARSYGVYRQPRGSEI